MESLLDLQSQRAQLERAIKALKSLGRIDNERKQCIDLALTCLMKARGETDIAIEAWGDSPDAVYRIV